MSDKKLIKTGKRELDDSDSDNDVNNANGSNPNNGSDNPNVNHNEPALNSDTSINTTANSNLFKTPYIRATARRGWRKIDRNKSVALRKDHTIPDIYLPTKLHFNNEITPEDMEKVAVGPCPKCKNWWNQLNMLSNKAENTLEKIEMDIVNVRHYFLF